MDASDLLLLAAVVLGFGLVSRRLGGTVVTPPMVFVALGLVLGPAVLGGWQVVVDESALHVLSELTLILVLFGDATRIDLMALRRELGLPVRLLSIGLPLSILLGALLAKLLLPSLGWWEAAALGAVLAPTDAALGQAVVSSPSVPVRIRQALNVESGLNDGIALPFVLVFLSFASMGHGLDRSPEQWALFAALQVTLGPLVGFAVAWLGGRAIHAAIEAGFVEESFERLSGLALALLCYSAAEVAGGNGFIAAFVGGVTFGNTQRRRCAWVVAFLEAEGQLLMLLVFLGLGMGLVVPAFDALTGPVVAYVLLSLTLVRMVAVSLSLLGSGVMPATHLFIGWFGPRGLASILYGILLLFESGAPHRDEIFHVIVLTAVGSVFLHGVTAAPGARWFGRISAQQPSSSAEFVPVVVHPVSKR